jgi:hypothetical protein
MKRFIAALTVAAALTSSLMAAPRDGLWKAVDEAIQKGLPRTAITNLEPIIAGALKDKAYGEAAKAIARKIVLEGNIEGNKPEEKITRMEAEMARAPKEILPLLRTIQANWYWHYFQQNRWRFMQRTATAAAPGNDFTTWDLPRLFAEIDKVFGQALSAPDQLKKTPVGLFDDVLTKGTVPDTYRPTLYDFVVQEALKFYTSGEQAGAKPQDAFEIAADSPIFGSAESFLAWKPNTTQTDSPKLKAIQLYQELLRFHEKDRDPTPFIDADIARLQWGHNVAFGETKNARYMTALQAIEDKWADHELSAYAKYRRARVLQQEDKLVEARTLALRAAQVFPESLGGKKAFNLVQEIEARSASISTERVWQSRAGVPPAQNGGGAGRRDAGPTLAVRYKNVTQVHFRAVAYDWDLFLDRRRSRPEWLNDNERKELLAKAPTLAWSAKLPPTPDFKERIEELPAPENLKPGFYFLLASHDPNFGETDNQVSYTDVWVSDLALVVVTRDGKVEGFVLNAISGDPIAGAEVTAWYLDRNGNRVLNGEPQRTDAFGAFSFTPREQRGLLLRARAQGQTLGSMQEYASGKPGKPSAREQSVIFTDRALYRPGQTISYKGIFLRVDTERDNYELLKGRRITAVFLDPNGKEVAKAEHVCNDYGSFSGSFTAPRDRVMGQYQIAASDGRAWFNVEEYKRPKFQVTLDAPKTAPKLNDMVSVQGKAEAYTGAAVDGAQVKWRVVREVRWPDWWGWWGWGWRRGGGRGNESQEIAHGTATTGTDGAFKVEFTARPDPQVDEKSEASFSFRVYADVTDTAGETRSADRSVNVGFVALRASILAEHWQTDEQPVELKLRTTTLDGEPQAAEGALKIYRLKEPAQVQRPRLAGLDRSDVSDPSDPIHWPEGDLALERGWTTDAEGKAAVQAKLSVGVYRAVLETQDRFGKKVTARAQLTVLQPGAAKLAIKVPNLVTAPQWQAEPGQEFMALWGTGYDQGRAFVEIEHRGQMVQRYWTKPDVTQHQIKQTVSEAMRGGFTVHVTQVRENRAYLSSHHVEVPWSNKDLELTWEHFTSKLEPGQKETWTLVVAKGSARGPRASVGGPPTEKSEPGSIAAGRRDEHAGGVRSPELATAEMVAALYDESLDAYRKHDWLRRFGFFRRDYSHRQADFCNVAKHFNHIRGQWKTERKVADLRYREFPSDLVANFWGYQWGFGGRNRFGLMRGAAVNEMVMFDGAAPAAAAMPAPTMAPPMEMQMAKAAPAAARRQAGVGGEAEATEAGGAVAGAAPAQGPDLSKVSARKNLNETAFFFPQLTSDSNGVVRMTFTMPEALTSWRFLGFAHDAQLRSGFLEGKAVTAKDLMVQPNPPRFLREDDVLEFTVKVSNQTAARQQGKVRLTFNEALNDASADTLLNVQPLVVPPSGGSGGRPAKAGTTNGELPFDIPAKESRTFAWRIRVPDGCGFLTYKAVASTGRVSDGEEGYLPVLSRRIFVTESLPLPVRVKAGQGAVTKKFEFTKLLQSGKSKTLQHQSYTVQMVSQPAWYAVMALPYLMEFPHECTEQTFNRLYANALARSIANSDPKIRRVFDQWKGTPALDSPLEKNQDLKAVMLEETPWLRQAQNESQARKNVGLLFDANRLDSETERTLRKLEEAQLGDGAWPWFPGGRGNDYITLYITTGFGRLRHLGVDLNVQCAIKSLRRLDHWMQKHYERILKLPDPDKYVPSPTDALYLYGRSFFLKDQAIAKNHQVMVDFFLGQARKHWLKTANRQSQGHLAIALKRWGGEANVATARDILRSVKERSVTNEEMGMFWRDLELSWWWYRAPIETQALMIEAFDEVMGDADAVEECRVWLLKQKQTQDWKTTKATADAIYALLLRGKNILASDKLVEVTVGGVNVLRNLTRPDPKAEVRSPKSEVEPGTGFYEVRFAGADVKPKLGEITVRKLDEGVAWGSVHWQYLEDMTKVTPYEGTPLKLKKSLYTKTTTKKGPVLEPVKGALQVGDEVVVRIELRVDRDMEYIHLKDQRGSGTEPVNVLSRYKYQDGLAYYESTRDTASHFFIDYLPKGTYVFEYATRVQHRGQYQTGMASIQCMYAPEFNSHSESFGLVVK